MEAMAGGIPHEEPASRQWEMNSFRISSKSFLDEWERCKILFQFIVKLRNLWGRTSSGT